MTGVTGVIVALVPAHNEESQIGTTLTALQSQTRAPDRIVVVTDNCTDRTAAIAKSIAGVEVFETQGNEHKKAGALNQALALLLPELNENDVILVQDADSQLDRDFVAAGMSELDARPRLGAVGGTFRASALPEAAPRGARMLLHLQDNEYARYARDVRRLNGRCLVVTGTAAMFRAQTLNAISSARLDGRLPSGDGRGGVYDTQVLTEDNELSFAIMHLGFEILAPASMTLKTETMMTWRDLWKQRLRWKRGAIENCVQYGLTRITWRYWGRQIYTMLGILVTATYLGSLVWAAFNGGVHMEGFWLAVTGVFCLERIITLHDKGWLRAIASGLMYEIPYDLFLQATHAKAYVDAMTNKRKDW
ncbi:MAG: glycosyltransferase family 2 protein [Dermatophilaceae bacterium]